MTDCHIVILVDGGDYEHLQRAYARLHITPSHVIRIAVDRFLTDADYRLQHPFAIDVAQPVEPERPRRLRGLEEPIQIHNSTKASFRMDRSRRDALRALLREPFSLGAFVRGALAAPGTVLQSEFVELRFRELVGETEMLRWWHDAPAEPVYDLDLIDAQPDMTRRRGAVLKRPKTARKLAI